MCVYSSLLVKGVPLVILFHIFLGSRVWMTHLCTGGFILVISPASSILSLSSWAVPLLEMKTVSEFFGISETDFEIFRSDSSITVFFENGISFWNFLSKSVWCFTDRFLRLPVFIGNYRFCVSEFFGIVSRIFFRIFQHVIFSHRLYVSGLRITYFCIF
jgi:hypothetical protein